ncbi:MAG TPA: DUF1289 domain-containing protein [Azospirillaceae bacterium]|nr:DUF1289 domain-containing protein [Azospirillaceae bacterium]
MAKSNTAGADSPCTRVCRIDPETGLCEGCMRSRAEIAAWSRMKPVERRALMAKLRSRAAGRQGVKP